MAALDYAARGWPMVACHTPGMNGQCSCGRAGCANVGKHPRYHRSDLAHGLHSATTDPASIHRWWQRWPNANIAIATGNRSGVFVLDSDHAGLYRLPATATVRTARGRHAYFHIPSGMVLRTRVGLLPHLDVRAIGGMAVAPPSLHVTGAVYHWEQMLPLLLPPAWLLALLAPRTRAPVQGAPQLQSVQRKDGYGTIRHGRAYADQALAMELVTLRTAPPGTRNRTLNWLAFRAGQFVAAGFVVYADV